MNRRQRRAAQARPAVACQPSQAATQNELGLTFARQGRLDEAAACHRRAISLAPGFPQAHNNLGLVLDALGRLEDAVASYRRAVSLEPGYARAHNNLGTALKKLGRPDEAGACYRQAVALAPAFAEAHNNLGLSLADRGDFDAAIACYRRALGLQPDLAPAHHNLAAALWTRGMRDAAVTSYRHAIGLLPTCHQAITNLAAALAELGRLEESAEFYCRVASLMPGSPRAHVNLGAAHARLARWPEAIGSYRQALALAPDLAEAHSNLAAALIATRDFKAAEASSRRAIAIDPDLPYPHQNLAVALLSQGDFEAGWPEYEWRWKMPQMQAGLRNFTQARWRGEQGDGRTLLIYAEQGFGDTLQFCRYAILAASCGLRVILAVQRPLVRLLRSLSGAALVLADDEPVPPFDFHCPMMSLPGVLKTTLATIPGATPYLAADRTQSAAWRARLAGPARRVGLVWAGNPHADAVVDRRRSMASALLAPLLDRPGLRFVSLQKDGSAAPPGLIDVMAEMTDFADTAALVEALDLVIAVDTAVAHLAAALGKPVWLLSRFDQCWRWLDGRRDSPWYPGLRIYRQTRPGDWASVVAEVAQDLEATFE